MKRGRKCGVDHDLLISVILKYKDVIVSEKATIVSKTAQIWITIANELDNKIKPHSVYAFACSRKGEVRSQVLGDCVQIKEDEEIKNSSESDSLNSSSGLDSNRKFIISLSNEEFDSIIKTQVKDKKTCIQFKEGGAWGDLLVQKIWCQTTVTCRFQFKTHYLTTDAASGSIKGKYKNLNTTIFSQYTYLLNIYAQCF